MIGTSKNIWGFDPRSVPGCQLWLDAADSNSMTLSGSNVTAWTDKSPLASPFTLSNGSGGSTIRTTYTGLPVVQVSNSCFFNASYSYPLATRSIFFVMAETVHSDWRGLLSFASNAAQSDYSTQNGYTITATNTVGSNVQFSQNFGNGGFNFNYNASNGTKDVPFQLYEDVTSNTAVTLFITGSNVYSSNTSVTPLTSTGLTVGGRNGIPSSGALVIAEVLLYSNVLTTVQRQQVEGYLAWKWGLTTYSPVTPLSIPGCQLWLDAADASTVTGTTTVTQWRDKSGNARHLGALSGTTSYSSNAIQLTNSAMFVTSPVDLSKVTVFIVAKTTGGYNQTVFVGRPNSSFDYTSVDGFGFYMDSQSVIRFYGTSSGGQYSTFNVNTSTPQLFSFQSSGTSISAWYNGNSQTGGTLGSSRTSTAQGFAIGASWNGSTSSYDNIIVNASLYEIIVFNSDVTTTQRQGIEAYLTKKWFGSSLPSIHPFSSIRPHLRTFQPADIPGCQLWLDAADSSSLVLSGSNVTQWNDKSGNGYHMNTIAGSIYWSGSAAYPTIGTSINGLQTVNFKAQSGLKQATTLDGVKNLFWVGRIEAATGSGTGPYYFLLGHDTYYDWHTPIGQKFIQSGAAQDGIANAFPASLFTNDPNAVTNTAFSSINLPSPPNVSLLSVAGITGNSRYQGICYDRTTHIGWCGDLAEVLIFNTALTTSQRQQVEGYLAQKWGLTPYLPVISPLSIPGCSLWLDGADPAGTGVTPSNGATVSTWVDKATAKNATATGTPTYLTGGGVNFNGSSYFLNQAFTMNLSQRSIFIVMQETSRTIYSGILTFIPTATSESDFFTVETTNGVQFYGAAYTSVLGNSSLIAKGIYNDNMNVTTGSGYFNGTNATNVTAGAVAGTSSGYTVGGRWLNGSISGSYRLNAVIYEIIVFNTPLTTSQRQTIEGYLARKWGISISATLPSPHPFKSILPATAAHFYPTDITGCSLWLDAADSSTLVLSGSNVTQWNDKSGNGRNVSASSSYPTFTTNGILFNGATPNVLSNAASFPSTTALNSFVVFISTVASTRQRVFVYSYSGQNRYVSTDTTFNSMSTNASQGYGPVSYSPNTTYIYSANTYTGSSISHSENGVESSYQLEPATVSSTKLIVGGESTVYFTGTICEIILYDAFFTTSQRQKVEGYLAHKWGLVNSLPSKHPYKPSPPIFPPNLFFPTPSMYSALFNAANNTALSIPSSSAFTLGTNNHTIEFWFYQTNRTTYDGVFMYGDAPPQWVSVSNYIFQLGYPNSYVGVIGYFELFTGGNTASLNAWHHFAVVRNGNTFTAYIDGISHSTATSSISIGPSVGKMVIGSFSSTVAVDSFTGYISNFRFVNGTAVYTSNFTPPTTPLTAIPNTQVLIQGLVDRGPNAFTVTNNGGVTLSTSVSPF